MNRKRVSYLFWFFAVICMGIIFWFSSRTGEQSAGQSSELIEWLTGVLGKDHMFIAILIIRKGAHCLEFTGLSVFFGGALFFRKSEVCFFDGIALTSLYAITDEAHQLFVEGRSCEIGDWAIDTFGALLGAVGLLIIILVCKAIADKRRKNEHISI